jgi:hypothetical protein
MNRNEFELMKERRGNQKDSQMKERKPGKKERGKGGAQTLTTEETGMHPDQPCSHIDRI